MPADIFKKGSVEMLVLHLLSKEDAHGYQLVQMIKERSKGLLSVQLPSLYPILYRLTDEGYITRTEIFEERSEKSKSTRAPRMRVVYHLEPSGQERLKELLKEHEDFMQGFMNILASQGKTWL